jgi:hypothetical protein
MLKTGRTGTGTVINRITGITEIIAGTILITTAIIIATISIRNPADE